jgi:hypothetical protein
MPTEIGVFQIRPSSRYSAQARVEGRQEEKKRRRHPPAIVAAARQRWTGRLAVVGQNSADRSRAYGWLFLLQRSLARARADLPMERRRLSCGVGGADDQPEV